MDKVFIKQLVVPALIGVLPEERKSPQNLLFDIEISHDIRAAAKNDDLTKTIDYAAVRRVIIEFVEQSFFELIETLADRLAEHLHQQFGFSAVRLSITKQPFDIPDAGGVGVIVEREYARH